MNLASNFPHPEAAFQAINRILRHVEAPKPHEKRISVRRQIMQPVLVQPCDADLNPTGDSVEGLSRDVSISGVGFLVTEAIQSPYVSIQFIAIESADSVFAEVIHQNQRGPVFVVGTKIMANWDA